MDIVKKVATQLQNHYKCVQDPDTLCSFVNFKTTVSRIAEKGDYLVNCGGQLNDPSFIQRQEDFFGTIVTFTKAPKKVKTPPTEEVRIEFCRTSCLGLHEFLICQCCN